MWKTILFDLDGTLTDSAPGITNAVAHALAHFGIHEEPRNLLKFIGPPLNESLPEFYDFTPEQTAEAVRVFREYFVEKGWCENAPYPGIGKLLQDLRAAGLRLMVATSKPEVQAVRILNHFGLAEYFDIDPTLVRVLWVIAFFCGTFGFWAYLICALIMPKKSDIYPDY